METGDSDFTGLTEPEIDFIRERDGFYMATVSETGWPYIQFRGGQRGYLARIERAMILHVEAFDWNCSQHISQRFTTDEIKGMMAPLSEYIEKLESFNI